LSNSNTTNWLLTAHPKLYYIAALAEAYAYYDDGDKWMAAQQDRDRLLSAIYTSDGSDQQGVNMRVRVDNGTHDDCTNSGIRTRPAGFALK
jgi:hypothetical protein